MMTKLSEIYKLNSKDFIKGLITAIFGAVIGIVLPIMQSGEWTFDWQFIGKSAMTAAVAYLFKNLLTNSDGEFLKKENN